MKDIVEWTVKYSPLNELVKCVKLMTSLSSDEKCWQSLVTCFLLFTYLFERLSGLSKNSELISLFRGKFTWVVRCSWHVLSSAALRAGKLTILVSPWLCSCSWASRHGWWPSRARWLCIWAWDTSPGLPLPAFCSSSGSHSMRSNCEVLFFPFSLPRSTAF